LSHGRKRMWKRRWDVQPRTAKQGADLGRWIV
jgi:hypothetical protein